MTITIKKNLAALGFLGVSFTTHAATPVIDAASIAHLVASYTQQVQQYLQQVQQFATQMQQLATEQGALNAIVGTRGMGVLANNQAARQTAPAPSVTTPWAQSGLQANATQTASQLASSTARVAMLQTLIGSIDGAADAKAAADLHNRIQAEHAFLLNEATMLQAGKDSQHAQAGIAALQNIEAGTARLHGSASPF